MTNREWLLNKMKNMSDEELAEVIMRPCDEIDKAIDCNNIKKELDTSILTCNMCIKHWLKQEHKEKITLSEAERIILENIDKEYKWIARDENNYLYVYETKPTRDKGKWKCKGVDLYEDIFVFNHLFQFITWNDSEPYNIEELLKGE